MQIIFNEIKKILHWKMIVLLLLINLIVYYLFIEFHLSVFPNGRPELDYYRIGIEMVDKYGEKMNEEEFVDFKKRYDEQLQEANQYLQSKKEFKDAGIHTYEDFRNIDEDEKQWELQNQVMHEERHDVFWELQTRIELIDQYERRKNLSGYGPFNDQQTARIQQIEESDDITSILPYLVFENYNQFILNTAMLVIISVLFIVSPTFLKDRLQYVRSLQYTAKTGRSFFKKKATAGLISTLIIVTVELMFYFYLYSFNETQMFFQSHINSIFNGSFLWFDLTFIQYIVISIIAVYILAIAFSLLAMSVSSIVANYIVLIGILLPIAIFTFSFGFDYLIHKIGSIYLEKWLAPICYISMITGGILFIFFMWKREKRMDIAA